jgi:hypothetical protein
VEALSVERGETMCCSHNSEVTHARSYNGSAAIAESHNGATQVVRCWTIPRVRQPARLLADPGDERFNEHPNPGLRPGRPTPTGPNPSTGHKLHRFAVELRSVLS